MADAAVLKEKVALAREFLLQEGLIRRFGHVSAFDPDSGTVFITPDLAWIRGHLTSQDILAMDLDGNLIEGHGLPPFARQWNGSFTPPSIALARTRCR